MYTIIFSFLHWNFFHKSTIFLESPFPSYYQYSWDLVKFLMRGMLSSLMNEVSVLTVFSLVTFFSSITKLSKVMFNIAKLLFFEADSPFWTTRFLKWHNTLQLIRFWHINIYIPQKKSTTFIKKLDDFEPRGMSKVKASSISLLWLAIASLHDFRCEMIIVMRVESHINHVMASVILKIQHCTKWPNFLLC